MGRTASSKFGELPPNPPRARGPAPHTRRADPPPPSLSSITVGGSFPAAPPGRQRGEARFWPPLRRLGLRSQLRSYDRVAAVVAVGRGRGDRECAWRRVRDEIGCAPAGGGKGIRREERASRLVARVGHHPSQAAPGIEGAASP